MPARSSVKTGEPYFEKLHMRRTEGVGGLARVARVRSDLPSVVTGERTLFACAVTSPRARLVSGMLCVKKCEFHRGTNFSFLHD